MTTTAPVSAAGTEHDRDDRRRDELVQRLFGALLGGMELLSIDVGRRLGLYRVLHEGGVLTDAELSERGGIAERYAAEWLDQQAVAGIVDVAGESADGRRRYTLPAPHADVLVAEDHPAHLMGAAPSLTGLALAVPAVTDAYRSGSGVAYAAFGPEIRHGIGSFNRPMFHGELTGWVRALPDVAARLDVGGARVLDLGCGTGWSSIGLARAFPTVRVHGVDLDDASIAEARRHAACGVADRVTFQVRDAAELVVSEPVALACLFEALHDMGRPVEVLRRVQEALAPGGAVLIGDERVAPAFTAPGDDVERLMYGWSVLHCLPATLAEPDHDVANGTVLRESTVHRWAEDAGFSSAQTLALDNDFWRFYRLDK